MRLGGLTMSSRVDHGQKVSKRFPAQRSYRNLPTQNQAVYKAAIYANTYSMMLMPIGNVLGQLLRRPPAIRAGLPGWWAVSDGYHSATFIHLGKNYSSLCRSWLTCTTPSSPLRAERIFEIIDTPLKSLM